MTEDEIRAEFERLADGYDLVVPRHVALAVAKLVADIADRRAREECEDICVSLATCEGIAQQCADAIRDTMNP
jgi:hypothetical protein